MSKRTHKLSAKEKNKISIISSKVNKTHIDKKLIQLLKETETFKIDSKKDVNSEEEKKIQGNLIQFFQRKENIINDNQDDI